jgi:hypothetical protein
VKGFGCRPLEGRRRLLGGRRPKPFTFASICNLYVRYPGSWFDRLGTTWIFNTGLQHGRPPVYIVIDLDENAAFWIAAGEAQRIDLHAPLLRPAAPILTPPPWLTSLGQIADPLFSSSMSDGEVREKRL